jgi:hypothetical protein
MKTCAYCGRQNEDHAIRCLECGTELSPPEAPASDSGSEDRLERIAVLDNEVQAELVDAVLTDRDIPHIMQSYHDSVYDGIFQTQKGWGILLAPPAFKAEILAAVEDIKKQSPPPLDTSGNE